MSEVRTTAPSTSPVDLIAIAFAAMTDAEQDAALARLGEIVLRRDANAGSESERIIGSLARVAEALGRAPTPDDYKRVRTALADDGVELEPLSRVIRHFGSWRMAKEALQLSDVTTARRIDARFASRRLGKIWRYTEETLRDVMARAVAEIGHPPLVAEFEFWRERQLELARARGEDSLHLPSANPYRRRWGTWEAALLHFGYTPDQVAERLERSQ